MIPKDMTDALVTFGLAFVPALFGIICHEVAHGWTAWKLGDPTARTLGRLTLNPVKHIDPVGFGVFVFTALLSPFVIGWAKPVPVDARYFRKPRQGMVLVSLAGPLTNFLVAFLCALLVRFTINLDLAGFGADSIALGLLQKSAIMGIGINCALAWFNLMPIPPLDGSHIVSGLLPLPLARTYASIGRYGMVLILAFVMLGFFGKVLLPLIERSANFIFFLANF